MTIGPAAIIDAGPVDVDIWVYAGDALHEPFKVWEHADTGTPTVPADITGWELEAQALPDGAAAPIPFDVVVTDAAAGEFVLSCVPELFAGIVTAAGWDLWRVDASEHLLTGRIVVQRKASA